MLVALLSPAGDQESCKTPSGTTKDWKLYPIRAAGMAAWPRHLLMNLPNGQMLGCRDTEQLCYCQRLLQVILPAGLQGSDALHSAWQL